MATNIGLSACGLAETRWNGFELRKSGEYGIPYAQLLDLAKRGELVAVQPPNVRRIFLVRADLERKLDVWKVA